MKEKLLKAMACVNNSHLVEAAKDFIRRRKYVVPIAAILVLTFVLVISFAPARVSARKVSTPTANRYIAGEGTDYSTQSRGALVNSWEILVDFASTCSTTVLSETDDSNRTWSPVSAYMSLAIAAELSDGQTRQELMAVLNAPDIDTLRQRVSSIWEHLSQKQDTGVVRLSNSLWLDNSLSYDQEGMDQVSYHYYTSVLQRNLGSSAAQKAVSNWIKNQSEGKLSYDGSIGTDQDNALALISSLYFQSDWKQEFDAWLNTRRTFHGNSEDYSTTFMYKEMGDHYYYWDDDFVATTRSMKNDTRIWLILPNEDKTVDQVLSSGAYMDMITSDSESPWENKAPTNVHLYLPKFKITSTVDLKDTLKGLGVQKIFDPSGGDFSKSLESSLPIFLSELTQNTRVELNEYGVISTGFSELTFWSNGPHDYVELIFDRPFIFIIEDWNLPLFVGVVNHP